jgi:hypothetical protein
MSERKFYIQFNAWEFRVVELEEDGRYRQHGRSSGDLQLAMRSASQELEGAMLCIQIEVARK